MSLLPSILFNPYPRVAAVSARSHRYLPIHTTSATEDWPPTQPLPIQPPSTPGEGPRNQHCIQGLQGLDCDMERCPAEGLRASLGPGLCNTGRSPVLISLGRFKSPGGFSSWCPRTGCEPGPHLIRRRGVRLSSSSGEPFVVKAEKTQRSRGMTHPKQALNIGQSKCSLGVPLAVNRNRACKAGQVKCHAGGQEGDITQSPRHSLSLHKLSPSLTP